MNKVWFITGASLGLVDLRHASIHTTGDVYVQTIETNVMNTMNSRTENFRRLKTGHSRWKRESD